MPEGRMNRTRSMLTAALLLGVAAAPANASDLSTYRKFRFGTDLATIATQTGVDASRVKIVHLRPALIQELEWRPGYLGPTTDPDTVKELVFRFYQGELYQIAVSYERFGTEGMTVDDFKEAISTTYGPAVAPVPSTALPAEGSSGSDEVVAQWKDALHQYDLIRSAYGPTFRLVGTQKKLETLAQAAAVEAARLDDQEAPQREAARRAHDEQAAAAQLDKARLTNKPKFRH